MNIADQNINKLYKSILQTDISSMAHDKGKNYKGDLLMSFSNEYENDIYKWELIICLKPGFKELSEDTIWILSMELKHKKNPYKRFQIIYSPSIKKLMVENWASTLYTRSENIDRKYPRARHSDSRFEQYKTHKIVVWWVNALQKLLLSSKSNDTRKNQVDLMKYL